LQVLTLNLQLTSSDWDKIRKDTTFEIEVPATFWADGEAGILVSVRRKRGKAIPSESNPQKVPLKIDINELVDGQKWQNLTKLSLENGGGSAGSPFRPGDFDVVREGLAWMVHRLASGPAGYNYLDLANPPKASAAACAAWVRLNVNGTYMGVYLSAEQRDKQFLKNRNVWVDDNTWIYEQEIGQAILDEGEGVSATVTHLCYSPFRAKRSATCNTPSDANLQADLYEWIDIRGLLALCAADAVIDNGDGLCTHGQNVSFADFTGGQTSLGGQTRLYFPWDLDSVLPSATNGSIYGRSVKRGSVTQTEYQAVILNHPHFRAEFNSMLSALINGGALNAGALRGFLDQLQLTTLPAALASDPYPTVIGSVSDHFNRLRAWITNRQDNINVQIAANGPPPPRQ
jgi:hypothetical protein